MQTYSLESDRGSVVAGYAPGDDPTANKRKVYPLYRTAIRNTHLDSG
jgi:hypothetical protein